MAITINGSGTITGVSAGGLPDGSVTADDLATSLDLTGKTVTLPSGTGGKILQVKQAVLSTTFEISTPANETYSELTGLSVTITPASASSKFLALINVAIDSNNNYATGLHLYRDTTQATPAGAQSVDGMTSFVTYQQPADTRDMGTQQNAQYLDSPNTTSQITYKVYGAKPTASTSSLSVNTLGGCSTLTVLEIA